MGIFTLAAATGALGLPLVWMCVIASLAGIGLGGIWAARSSVHAEAHATRSGRRVLRAATEWSGDSRRYRGPVLWALTTYLAVERGGLSPLSGQSIAIVVLLVMVVISFVILRAVSDERRIPSS